MICVLFALLCATLADASAQPDTVHIMNGAVVVHLSHTKTLEYRVNAFLVVSAGSVSVYRGEYFNVPLTVYRFCSGMQVVHQKNLAGRFGNTMTKAVGAEAFAHYRGRIGEMLATLRDLKKDSSILWYTFYGTIFQEQAGVVYQIHKEECPRCDEFFETAMDAFVRK